MRLLSLFEDFWPLRLWNAHWIYCAGLNIIGHTFVRECMCVRSHSFHWCQNSDLFQKNPQKLWSPSHCFVREIFFWFRDVAFSERQRPKKVRYGNTNSDFFFQTGLPPPIWHTRRAMKKKFFIFSFFFKSEKLALGWRGLIGRSRMTIRKRTQSLVECFFFLFLRLCRDRFW